MKDVIRCPPYTGTYFVIYWIRKFSNAESRNSAKVKACNIFFKKPPFLPRNRSPKNTRKNTERFVFKMLYH